MLFGESESGLELPSLFSLLPLPCQAKPCFLPAFVWPCPVPVQLCIHQGKREKIKGEMKVSGCVGHTVLRALMEWEEGCLPAGYCAQGHQ